MQLSPNPKPDWPLWSPARLLAAFAFWLFLTVEHEGADVPFWQTIKYRHRPEAAAQDGKPWLG